MTSARSMRRHRALADEELLVARMNEAMVALDAARTQLGRLRGSARPLREIRTAFHRVSSAYGEAIRTAEVVELEHAGGVNHRLDRLRTQHQEHLLSAEPGVVLPLCVRPNSDAALGPHYAGMNGELTFPLGPPTERARGVDLAAVLDEVTTPA